MIQLLFITQSLEVNILIRTKMQRGRRLFLSIFSSRCSLETTAKDGRKKAQILLSIREKNYTFFVLEEHTKMI